MYYNNNAGMPSQEELRLAAERRQAAADEHALIERERQAILDKVQAHREAERARERAERQQPIARIAGVLATRLGDDLAWFARELRQVDLKALASHLDKAIADDAARVRAQADAANRAYMATEHASYFARRQAELDAGVL